LPAVERERRAGAPGPGLQAFGAPAAVVLGHRERDDGGSRGDAGQHLPLRRGIPARLQRVHGEDRGGEVRRAEEHATHLLQHDELLDGAAASAAVLLGNRQPLETELLRHLRPDRPIVAVVGLHQPPHLPRRRLVLEGTAPAAPELLLLLAEREGHDVSFSSRDCVPTVSARNGTSFDRSRSAGSPSTRSPMMLRWIWSVPPYMAGAGGARIWVG